MDAIRLIEGASLSQVCHPPPYKVSIPLLFAGNSWKGIPLSPSHMALASSREAGSLLKVVAAAVNWLSCP